MHTMDLKFVIYSPNESAMCSGAGFWNAQRNAWVELDEATLFLQSDQQKVTLPNATGQDAKWILHDKIRQYY